MKWFQSSFLIVKTNTVFVYLIPYPIRDCPLAAAAARRVFTGWMFRQFAVLLWLHYSIFIYFSKSQFSQGHRKTPKFGFKIGNWINKLIQSRHRFIGVVGWRVLHTLLTWTMWDLGWCLISSLVFTIDYKTWMSSLWHHPQVSEEQFLSSGFVLVLSYDPDGNVGAQERWRVKLGLHLSSCNIYRKMWKCPNYFYPMW